MPALTVPEHFYFYNNLPIKWVRIVGVVVAVEQFVNRRLYSIDDSSGSNIFAVTTASISAEPKNEVAACEPRAMTEARAADLQQADPYADIDVGTVVDVKGGLSTYRDERQINIEKMVIVKNTAQEVVLWEKRTKFHRDILDIPWLLRDKDIRHCCREAERSEAKKEQKRVKEEEEKKQPRKKAADAKLPVRGMKRKGSDDDGAAKRMRMIIKEHALTGKYSALGL
ncbi:hypothetical protein TGAM01_v202454 [Trichoderma gamsii]|uniref:CST complex subunit STN1 n=1 Tax=Trichoderma gamsii TaxID=398673 RepID=A0A2P4ZWE0_9HYPO|nr:hypothetical protein TGAM01_v202454 [Trichoderma gamsii]PON28607.1 hypothetical protein TGAM01_v202454 [Trichoderma gamsii]